MGLIGGGWLLLLSVLALLVARLPISKPATTGAWLVLVPAMGLSALSMLWGTWSLISAVLTVGWLSTWPVLWLTMLSAALLMIAQSAMIVIRALRMLTAVGVAGAPSVALTTLAGLGAALAIWEAASAFLFRAG